MRMLTMFATGVPFVDGVAKTRQLLRCCNRLAASTYVSTPHCSAIARLAFGAYCLAIHLDAFEKASFVGAFFLIPIWKDRANAGVGKGLRLPETSGKPFDLHHLIRDGRIAVGGLGKSCRFIHGEPAGCHARLSAY